MPIDRKGDLFDRECDDCGNHGMTKTQVPSPGEPTLAFKCPECGYVDPSGDPPGYAQKL